MLHYKNALISKVLMVAVSPGGNELSLREHGWRVLLLLHRITSLLPWICWLADEECVFPWPAPCSYLSFNFESYWCLQVAMSLACGSMAGVFSSSFTFPLDLVRRRIQLSGQHGGQQQRMRYKDVVQTIMARDGFRGFYAGLLPEYYKVCFHCLPACTHGHTHSSSEGSCGTLSSC